MRKFYYPFAAAAAMAAVTVSCAEQPEDMEPVTGNIEKTEMTFMAEALSTRTALQSDDRVFWSEGDNVSIFSNGENEKFEVSEINGSSAVITGSAAESGTYYAVYPYNEDASWVGEGIITTVLPEIQPAVNATFGEEINLSAAVAKDGNLVFSNLCGLAALTVNSVPEGKTLTSISIQGRSGEIIAGAASVNMNEMSVSAAQQGGSMTVSLTGENIVPGTYYFTMFPVELASGAVITFTYADGTSASIYADANIALLAGLICELPAIDAPVPGDGTEGKPYKLASAADLQNMHNMISEGKTVFFSLVDDVDMKGIEWTPLYAPESLADETYPVIYFEGNGHVISNLTVSGKHASFFGVLTGNCWNLTFENPSIESDGTSPAGAVASALVSRNGITSEIVNVQVSGGHVTGAYGAEVEQGTDGRLGVASSPAYAAGGICGVMRNGGRILGSSSSADVDGTIAGGIIGTGELGGEVTECRSYGNITAHGKDGAAAIAYAGGIAGLISGSGGDNRFWIKECYSAGTLTSTDLAYSSGGIAGIAKNDTWIETSYSEAVLHGRVNAGGIVGSAWGTWGLTVKNCVAWCKEYHTAPYSCDEKFGNGYVVGAWKGGYNEFSDCWSNSASVSLEWLNPDTSSEGTLTPDSGESVNVNTGGTEASGNRYCGQSAASLEAALSSAGITPVQSI